MGTEEKAELLSFEENERVLCYHGPLIYEAKVRKNKRGAKNRKKRKKNLLILQSRFWKENGWTKIPILRDLITLFTTKAGREGSKKKRYIKKRKDLLYNASFL